MDPLGASARVGDPWSWNRYAYVGGDPINRNEPSGNYWCTVGNGEHQEVTWCEDYSTYLHGDQNAYKAFFNCTFFHTGCSSGYPTPVPTVTQQATTPGSGGITAAREAAIRFVGIQFSAACENFLNTATGLSVASVQAKAADADIVDGTSVTTLWGSTLFPGDPANAAGNQDRADAATGIIGATMAQYLTVSRRCGLCLHGPVGSQRTEL